MTYRRNKGFVLCLIFAVFSAMPGHSFAQTFSWQKLPFLAPTPISFAIDSSGTYYCTYGDSVYWSSDRGNSWVKANGIYGCEHITISPYNVVYQYYDGGAALFSRDHGIHWDSLSALGPIHSLAFHGDSTVCAIEQIIGDSIALSGDRGKTWLKFFGDSGPRKVFISSRLSILIAGQHNISLTRDSGKTWFRNLLPTQTTNVYAIEQYKDSIIFVATDIGIFQSVDDGSHFKTFAFTGHSIQNLAFDQNGSLFAATSEFDSLSGLYSTGDNGAAWDEVFRGLPYTSILTIDHDRDNAILFSANYNGLLLKPNPGASLKRISSLPIKNSHLQVSGYGPNESIFILENSPNGVLFANRNGSLFKTDDSGSYWFDCHLRADDVFSPTLLTLPDNELYFATFQNNYDHSLNSGLTWEHALYPYDINATSYTAFTIASDRMFYLGDDIGSIYRSSDKGKTWASQINKFPSGIDRFIECKSGAIVLFTFLYGIQKSTDKGKSWVKIADNPYTFGTGNGPFFETSSWGDLYLIADSSLYRSTNEGSGWTRINLHTFPKSITCTKTGSVFVGSKDGKLLYSTNKGQTFSVTSDNLPVSPILRLSIDSSGFLYAALFDTVYNQFFIYKTSLPYFQGVSKPEASDNSRISSVRVYPNPVFSLARFAYEVLQSSFVSLSIYSLSGNEVIRLVYSYEQIGEYSTEFDASHLRSGVYYYRLQIGERIEIKSLIVTH